MSQLLLEEEEVPAAFPVSEVKEEAPRTAHNTDEAEAKWLLEVTKKTPAEIAEVLGYSSQSYFQSVFKKSTGKTPGEYRAEGKGQ